jgi:peptide/nickel transport system permease protein
VGLFASVPGLLLAVLFVGLSTKDLAAIAAGLGATPIAFVRAYDRTQRDDFSAHARYARATGISRASLLRRDLTYEFRNNFLQSAARAIAAVTIMLSTASFLGFGATPPHRDLGLMIAAARPNYLSAWWTAAFPALALILLILFARLAASLEEGERP